MPTQLTFVRELVAEPHAELARGQDAEALLQGDVRLNLVVEVLRHVGGVVSGEHAAWTLELREVESTYF